MSYTRIYRLVPPHLRPIYFQYAKKIKNLFVKLKIKITEKQETARRGKNNFPPNAPVIVVGIFSSPTGIGQGARLMWDKMRKDRRLVEAVDVTSALGLPGGKKLEGVLDERAFQKLQPSTIVVHLNPPEFEKLYFKFPKKLRRNSKIIAYWAWELEIMPEEWRITAKLCDEIWVPSDFVAYSAIKMLEKNYVQKITVVPHHVAKTNLSNFQLLMRKKSARARYGFNEDDFIVGYSFAFSSVFSRKNPIAVIVAFQKAFSSDNFQGKKLLLRYRDGHVWPHGIKLLENEAKKDNRIILINANESKIDMDDFYDILNVYMSLHRSEGYGITLIEAANRGVKVITTGWWLAKDIENNENVIKISWKLIDVDDPQNVYNVCGARWADPDVNDASQKLHMLYCESKLPSGNKLLPLE